MAQEKIAWGLFRRRQVPVPTWRGWILLALFAALVGFFLSRITYPFLAVTASRPGGVLVVEGWAPDYALSAAIQELHNQSYQKLFTTGGPLENGAPLSEYKTFAELGAATLLKLGASTNMIQPAPAPLVRRDRTYASAIALRQWMQDHGMSPSTINVITIGPHARRSRLLFEKVFGKSVSVGIIAIPPSEYDQANWWRSSAGVRSVTSEALAYAYVRFLFRQSSE